MRSRSSSTAAVAATIAAWMLLIPSGSSANSNGPVVAAPAVAASASVVGFESLAGLSLQETRDRVADTEALLRVTVLQKESDDRELAQARSAVAELQDETDAIAEKTVETAITNYRKTDLDRGLLEIDDLNADLRANALGDAAIVSDTASFDRYRDKIKDLELAEGNLGAEQAENDQLTGQVVDLQAKLAYEQSWLADMEERTIQQGAQIESIVESNWARLIGTKQGHYLLTCPVAGDHHFIDSWGFSRSGGRRHKGVDIMADIGVPIVSPVNGTVSYRSNRVGGRSFHLYDEFGNYFYGTHLSAYGDVEGEVRAGQVIGFVGDDGNAAGIPHLHFEIHPGGRGNQINPFPDSAAVCDGAQ